MAYLITDDWQFQLGGLLIGDCCTVCLVGVDGLGEPAPKTRDVDLDMSNGVVFGPDFTSSRAVALNVVAKADDDAVGTATRSSQALLRARTVWAAWVPSSANQVLYGRLPGWGAFSLTGRPRGASLDMSKAYLGAVDMQLTFVTATSAISW